MIRSASLAVVVSVMISMIPCSGSMAAEEETAQFAFPAVASVQGVTGEWRTELVISNPNDIQVIFWALYLPRDESDEDPAWFHQILEPGQTFVFEDLIGSTMGLAGSAGGLVCGANRLSGAAPPPQPVLTRLRVYNTTETGIFGQGLNPQKLDELAAAGEARFIGLVRNDDRYSNLAILNPSDEPITVMVQLLDSSSILIGSESIRVERAVFFTDLLSSLFHRTEPAVFTVAVISLSGGSGTVPAVASIVERGTGDATTVEPQFLAPPEDDGGGSTR